MTDPPTGPSRDVTETSQARTLLAALTLINLLNYIDRYLVPGVAASLSRSSLHLDRGQIGLLGTGFILVYALASPWFGRLGDTGNRPRLIALGVGIWSIATVFGGLAVSFITLFAARAVLGIGEAAYGSIAPSLLADAFARKVRARVFSLFYAAIPIGSALGYVIAGAMASQYGWRSAFLVTGIPGLILAAFVLRLPEVPRGAHDDPTDIEPARSADAASSAGPAVANAPPVPPPSGSVWRDLLRNHQYHVVVLGYAAYTFALGALAFWFPDFLVSFHGMSEARADALVGVIAVMTGFAGTFAGGWIADLVLRWHSRAYLLVSGIATIAAVPFAVLALTASTPAGFFAGLVLAELLLFASTGPINSAIVGAVPANQRATAMAMSILAIHLLGDAPSPAIVGFLARAGTLAGRADGAALQHAMLILPIAILLGGVIWVWGALRPVTVEATARNLSR